MFTRAQIVLKLRLCSSKWNTRGQCVCLCGYGCHLFTCTIRLSLLCWDCSRLSPNNSVHSWPKRQTSERQINVRLKSTRTHRYVIHRQSTSCMCVPPSFKDHSNEDMVSFEMISLISSNVMQDQTMSVQCVCANIEMYTTNDSRSHQNEWLKSFVCVLQNGFCSVLNWVNFRRLFDEETAWTTQFSCNPDSIWLMEMDPMSDEQARRRKYQAWLKYVQSLCMPSEYRAIHEGLLL